jgi:hypothetical protein
MVTVVFGKTEEYFWSLTPRKTGRLIDEWQRMEGEKMKQQAALIGYAVASYQVGKVPFQDEKREIIVDNDQAFASL